MNWRQERKLGDSCECVCWFPAAPGANSPAPGWGQQEGTRAGGPSQAGPALLLASPGLYLSTHHAGAKDERMLYHVCFAEEETQVGLKKTYKRFDAIVSGYLESSYCKHNLHTHSSHIRKLKV